MGTIIWESPKIDRIIFKIVSDDNAQAMQLLSKDVDLALLDPANAKTFQGKDEFVCYDMTTADYRGILFNFQNEYWTKNKDLISAGLLGIDRQAIIDSVLLGQGMAPTVRCSEIFTTMNMWSIMTTALQRQRQCWKRRDVLWVRTVFMSGTEKPLVLCSV